MDGVKLSEIKGLMMSYRERGLYVNPDSPCYDDAIAQDACMFTANLIIAEQGSRKITLNREKLATILFNNSRKILVNLSPKSENIIMKDGSKLIPNWEEADNSHKDNFRNQADAIIANAKEIIVFKQ